MQWHIAMAGSLKSEKANITLSARKLMATFLSDSEGVLHVNFLMDCYMLNAEYYLVFLKHPVKAALKTRESQLSVSFLQDNWQDEVVSHIMAVISKLKWNIISHPLLQPPKWVSARESLATMRLWYRLFRSGYAATERLLPERHCKLPDHWYNIADQGDYVREIALSTLVTESQLLFCLPTIIHIFPPPVNNIFLSNIMSKQVLHA